MTKYILTYEVAIEAEDLDQAEDKAEIDDEELKRKAKLRSIKGEGEGLERFYEGK